MVGLHADEKKSWVFKKDGPIWTSYNVVMQWWTYGEETAAEPGMRGWDVIHVGSDGKAEKLHALIQGLSTH